MSGREPQGLRQIEVEVGRPLGRTVSPDLWGLFLEDINFSLDGGLNADLVRNGDFEAGPADRPGWGPLTAWSVEAGTVTVASADPISQTNATYVRMAPEDVARLVNHGYGEHGMALPGGDLRLSLAARSLAAGASLSAYLRPLGAGEPGAPVALAPASGGQWQRLEAVLRSDASRAELVLEVRGGEVDVDLVELRPVGPDGAPLLFRQDLVDALRALHPAFVRFPGGCVVHGFGLDAMYHWKATIGPREQRRGMPGPWSYRQSMAIGYHEYFLLCEQLGAAPLPVVAAGVCCQNVPGGPQAIPAGRMPQYVQDVLDLVEYANGSPGSRWGAVRAAAGHPEPFGLRALGLGNEDTVDAQFAERFAQLAAALRDTHPEVELIGTAGPWPFGVDFEAGWDLCRRLGVDLVDEHAYRTPRWMWQNHERYDSYDREGPAVYLGEWAARSSTIRSAVAEAAFMIGLERNSDVVRRASYAPLLARAGDTQWTPDLLYFTDEVVLGSAAYDVHRLFAEHRGDQVLGTQVSGAPRGTQPPPRLGPVQLTSPGAVTAFTDITADGVPLADVVVDQHAPAVALDVPASTTHLALTATRRDGTEGFVVRLGDPAVGTTHEVIVGSWRNRSLILSRSDEGLGDEVDGPYVVGGVTTAVPRRIDVELEGRRLVVRHDGVVVHDHVDDGREWPQVVAGATLRVHGGRAERVVTLVNGSTETVTARVLGPDLVGDLVGHVTALHGCDPHAGAAFERSPFRRELSTVHGRDEVRVELPPWSVAAVRLEPVGVPA